MNQFLQIIKDKYPGRAVLNKEEVCDLLRISPATLNRILAHNELDRIPKFKRFGNGPKARYLFPVNNVAEFLEA